MSELLPTSSAKRAAAVSGSQTAADPEQASGKAVIAIGGWSGTDDAPTFEQFTASVAAGEIDFCIVGGQDGGQGSSDSASGEIATWVAADCTTTTMGSRTVHDLTP